MRVADRDEIWSRGGVPVEELPDPFAPSAGRRLAEAADEAPPPEAAALADRPLFDCRR